MAYPEDYTVNMSFSEKDDRKSKQTMEYASSDMPHLKAFCKKNPFRRFWAKCAIFEPRVFNQPIFNNFYLSIICFLDVCILAFDHYTILHLFGLKSAFEMSLVVYLNLGCTVDWTGARDLLPKQHFCYENTTIT